MGDPNMGYPLWPGQDGVPPRQNRTRVPPGQVRMEYPPPPPQPEQDWGYLLGEIRMEYPPPPPSQDRTGVPPGQVRMGIPPVRSGWSTPPPPRPGLGYPPFTGQLSEHLLRVGRYASCVHAGVPSCCVVNQ